MDRWKDIVDRMEAIPDKNNELLLEIVNYQYGYIGYCIEFEKKDDARKYLRDASGNIEILEERNYKPALINAYKSAIYGFRISLNPITAPVNGPKSLNYARIALEMDPDNFFCYIQNGNVQLNMPSAFGGSKEKALEDFLKAKQILEKDPGSVTENWNYMSLLILIGKTYIALEDYSSAKKVYEGILRTEPGFVYVRNYLYPQLVKQMETQ